MESCEIGLIRYVLFIFNLVFAISGLGIIIAGALVLSDIGDVQHFMESEILASPIVLIVAGVIVFAIAFLGCFGAIRKSYNLLIAFSVCLLIIFITELAIGIVAAVYKNDFGDAFKLAMKKSIEKYSQSDLEKTAWNDVQDKLHCCGVEGPSDWLPQPVPFSCCYVYGASASEQINTYCINAAKGKHMYQKGCYDQLKTKVNENAKVLIGVGIGIAFIEVVGIVLACWLAHAVKKEDEDK